MIRVIIIMTMLLSAQLISGQKATTDNIRIVFLNAGNFFDTTDDPGEADDKFSSGGEMNWDNQKYDRRKNDLASVIAETGNRELPGLIAMSGIENDAVANDILSSGKLRRENYRILASSYYPGSGVILAARDEEVELLEKRVIISDLNPAISEMSVMLYLKVNLENGLTTHLFINEWPSRLDQGAAAGSMRMACAAAIRKEIDMVLNFDRDARIIIMGGFNDEPTSGGVINILNATNKRKNLADRDLFNLYYDMHNFEDKGTTKVNGIWQMNDFIIVSPSLLKNNSAIFTSFEGGKIGEPSESFGPVFRGSDYLGGSGAHLPVFFDLTINKND